ncbi:YdcF family protein [Corynebacterium sp. YIM 101645]|uniref:YdcF family protein n=1 Tax=Corynebacterium lemuris TaxID=1859292 RepID=A0ABT2FTT4_9CORY|nr:YdcF family protein [Corynebacterium lemuris]MCS5478626.1 YdcF family protein [Corynebacterium lemuris]
MSTSSVSALPSDRPVLVLGARTRHGRPGRILTARLARALQLIDTQPVVVSGRGEAAAMAEWLVGRGVDEQRILLEPLAVSTNENLENAQALLPDTRCWTVVSSDFHVWRTRLWARHLGIPVTVVSARTPGNLLVPALLRECLALPHSALRIAWRRLRT